MHPARADGRTHGHLELGPGVTPATGAAPSPARTESLNPGHATHRPLATLRRAVPVTATLLQRIASGDESAVGETLDHYGGLVLSLARRLCPPSDVDDAVQDVFIEVWRHAERFDPSVAKEVTFVSMITRRRLIDRLRRAGRVPVPEPEEASKQVPAPTSTDAAETQDELDRVRAAIARLDPDQQQLIQLTLVDGMTHAQAAEHLELPLGTVKSRVRRGLIKLRAELGQ